MKHKIKNIGKFIRKHYIISVLIGIVLVFGGYKVFSGGTAQETFTVKTGVVTQKVIVTGKTKPVHEVELGFDVSGRVSKTYVAVGSRVGTGQTLVALDNGELYGDHLKAEANVATEEAKLDELKAGTRPEEIAVAQIDVTNAENNLNSKILDSFTKADDAIHNNIDQLFSNPRTNNPQFSVVTSNSQLKSDIEAGRFAIEGTLSDWKLAIDSDSAGLVLKSDQNLTKIKSFVDKIAEAINSSSGTSNLSPSTIDTYKTNVSTARSNISAAISAQTSAESTLASAQGTLSLKKNGNTPEVIRGQEAKLLQAKAALQSVDAQLHKLTLYSPQSGVVTKQDAKAGETVTAGKALVSIISDNNLEVEANVSEISVGKVMIGNPVSIVFDAFPGEKFSGTVTYVEPGETIVDGVVNYKVTVAFSKSYPEIKSGLTSKLEIITASKDNVLIVPQYALIHRGDEYFVQIGEKDFVERPVTVGLIGQDGMAEIVSGLSVGDTVKAVSK